MCVIVAVHVEKITGMAVLSFLNANEIVLSI